jgi:hypothetical protein
MDDREALFEDCVETLGGGAFYLWPVHVRWMYPYERYYKTLKSFVRNFAR